MDQHEQIILATVRDAANDTYNKAEAAIGAYTEGFLDPSHLHDIRDAAGVLRDSAEQLFAEPAGSPVPDGPTTARTLAEQAAAEQATTPADDEPKSDKGK